MAQSGADNNDAKRLSFDSPEATVIVLDKTVGTQDRIVFEGPDATVKVQPNTDTAPDKKRIEFTSPAAATSTSVNGKRDDE